MVWVTMTCLFAACASVKSVDPAGPFEEREIDDTLVLHLRNGETLTTNRASVTDSTFVLRTLIEDGKERRIDPMTVRRDEVESMSRIKPRWPVIIGIAAVATAGIVLLRASFAEWSMGD